jgi:hypothetical protein
MDKKNTMQLLTVVGVFAVDTGVSYLYWYLTPQILKIGTP